MLGGKIGVLELIILGILMLFFVFPIVGWAKIFAKAGYSAALSVLMFIPVVNLILFFWFAYANWPIERQLRANGQYQAPRS